jgi:hypothetical protein
MISPFRSFVFWPEPALFGFWPIVGPFVFWPKPALLDFGPLSALLCFGPSRPFLDFGPFVGPASRPMPIHLRRRHVPPSLATRQPLVFSGSVRAQFSPPAHAAVAGHPPASCLLRQCARSVFTTGPRRSIFVAATCRRRWPPASLLSSPAVCALSLHHRPPFISHRLCPVPGFRCRRHQKKKKKFDNWSKWTTSLLEVWHVVGSLDFRVHIQPCFVVICGAIHW